MVVGAKHGCKVGEVEADHKEEVARCYKYSKNHACPEQAPGTPTRC